MKRDYLPENSQLTVQCSLTLRGARACPSCRNHDRPFFVCFVVFKAVLQTRGCFTLRKPCLRSRYDSVFRLDIIRHEVLTLEHMHFPWEVLQQMVKLYGKPVFNATIEGQTSTWHQPTVGFRQGCPLSPSLFIIVLSAVYHDTEAEAIGNKLDKSVMNTLFDEMYMLAIR